MVHPFAIDLRYSQPDTPSGPIPDGHPEDSRSRHGACQRFKTRHLLSSTQISPATLVVRQDLPESRGLVALIGPIVDRIGELWSIRAGTASLILGLVGYPLARSFLMLAIIIPLVPIGLALLFPATTALMSRASDPSELGTTMGTAQTFAGIARVCAPLLSTSLFQYVGHGAPFLFSATIMAGISLLSFQMGTVSAPEPVHVVD